MRERQTVAVDQLDDVMEFDHVIQVHEDGTVSGPVPDLYAPDLYAINDGDGSHTAQTDPELCRQARAAGWTLESGWTGQYSYSGPCMHESEFIGGGLARYILATPGYWVAVVVYEDDDSEPSCWALAYRETLTNGIPDTHPVRPLADGDPAVDRVTCGTCGRSWDDAVVTEWTPAPSARCPFEYWH